MSAPQQALLIVGGGGGALPTVTWNPADTNADIALSGGNLIGTKINADAHKSTRATRGIAHTDNGYFEVFINSSNGATAIVIGVGTASSPLTSYVGSDANGWSYYGAGDKITNGTATAFGASFTTGDIIGVAFKNGKVWFAKNNTYQGSGNPAAGTGEAFSGITGTIYPILSLQRATATAESGFGRFNSGNSLYAPPAGFSYWGA